MGTEDGIPVAVGLAHRLLWCCWNPVLIGIDLSSGELALLDKPKGEETDGG